MSEVLSTKLRVSLPASADDALASAASTIAVLDHCFPNTIRVSREAATSAARMAVSASNAARCPAFTAAKETLYRRCVRTPLSLRSL